MEFSLYDNLMVLLLAGFGGLDLLRRAVAARPQPARISRHVVSGPPRKEVGQHGHGESSFRRDFENQKQERALDNWREQLGAGKISRELRMHAGQQVRKQEEDRRVSGEVYR
jgi:hypothetical protein